MLIMKKMSGGETTALIALCVAFGALVLLDPGAALAQGGSGAATRMPEEARPTRWCW